jgi:hypothetical protein
MDIEPAPVKTDSRDKYVAWMARGELPTDRAAARCIARMAKSFALVDGELYKRAASGILQLGLDIEPARLIIARLVMARLINTLARLDLLYKRASRLARLGSL